MEAIGKLGEFKEWALELSHNLRPGLWKLNLKKKEGVKKFTLNIDKLFNEMDRFWGGIRIEELPVKFTAVAVDLTSKREVWLQEGSLKEAVRASIAIPRMIEPVRKGRQLLIDGGILNLLPIAPVIPDQNDLIVAVSLYGDDFSVAIPPPPDRSLKSKFWDTFFKNDMVVEEAINLMMETLMRYKKAEYRPDIQIKIPRYIGEWYEFYYIDYFIKVGREVATQVLLNYIRYKASQIEAEHHLKKEEMGKKRRFFGFRKERGG
jgi:NTE family protein